VFGPLGSEWDDFAVQPDDFVCDGDHAVVIGTYNGRNRATGDAGPLCHSWQLRDGRAARFEQITDTDRWNEASD
jgi:ketosteroid isomerase-like protein